MSENTLIRYDKRSCLQRAKNILAKNDDSLLRYVCLELRFCLEVLTYQKLRLYSPRLPVSILEKWQPPQAMKALLQFEPLADQNYELRNCTEQNSAEPNKEWKSLGSHRTFRVSWLNKHYNKLGSYLHIPSITQTTQKQPDEKSLRNYLEELVKELTPIVESTVDTSLAETLDFECDICHQIIIVNYDRAISKEKVICLNPKCQAEFAPIMNGEDIGFKLIAVTFECHNCGEKNYIEGRKLSIGFEFSCSKCTKKYKIETCIWNYSPVVDK